MTSFSAKTVIFIVFPNIKLLDLTGPMQVFADAHFFSQEQYELVLVSENGGDVPSDTGMSVATEPITALNDLTYDTVIVAGGSGAFTASENTVLLKHVQSLYDRSRRMASVCTGAFVLARAGLLSGRSAVTHWDSCARLRAAFPDIDVQEDAIYVRDDRIWTSAGVTAGIDMSLAMVAEDVGRKPALELARSLVCYMVRPGGQTQFSGPLRQQTQIASDLFGDLNAWIMDNLSNDLSIQVLANRAMMSPRNFARLYKQHMGISPAKAVEKIRIDAASQLLEETDLRLQEIADQCGFFDVERLRRAMMRGRNIAPGEYRARFRTGQAAC